MQSILILPSTFRTYPQYSTHGSSRVHLKLTQKCDKVGILVTRTTQDYLYYVRPGDVLNLKVLAGSAHACAGVVIQRMRIAQTHQNIAGKNIRFVPLSSCEDYFHSIS